MSYASIIVAVDPGERTAPRIGVAAHLARRLDARLIGVAAWAPDYPRGFGETSVPTGYGIEDLRQKAFGELHRAEETFRLAARPAERIEWRSELRETLTFLAEQSRAADLVVVGRQGKNDLPHHAAAVGPGDALMTVGRPILVVPHGVERLSATRVVVAWKDTPQGRRAISDAMPFLTLAEQVQVVQVAEGTDRTELEDVVAYLGLDGVKGVGDLQGPEGWRDGRDPARRRRDVRGGPDRQRSLRVQSPAGMVLRRRDAHPPRPQPCLLPDVSLNAIRWIDVRRGR